MLLLFCIMIMTHAFHKMPTFDKKKCIYGIVGTSQNTYKLQAQSNYLLAYIALLSCHIKWIFIYLSI